MNEFPHLLPVYPNFVSEIYLYRLLCGDAPEAVREMNKVLLEFFFPVGLGSLAPCPAVDE